VREKWAIRKAIKLLNESKQAVGIWKSSLNTHLESKQTDNLNKPSHNITHIYAAAVNTHFEWLQINRDAQVIFPKIPEANKQLFVCAANSKVERTKIKVEWKFRHQSARLSYKAWPIPWLDFKWVLLQRAIFISTNWEEISGGCCWKFATAVCFWKGCCAARCCKEPLGQIVCVPSARRSRWVLFIYIIIPLFFLLLILFISRLYKYEMFSVDDTNRARSSPPPPQYNNVCDAARADNFHLACVAERISVCLLYTVCEAGKNVPGPNFGPCPFYAFKLILTLAVYLPR
jgi:hypothetical protein